MESEQDADYVRQLEDACLAIWDGLCDDDALQLQADTPELVEFVKQVRTRWWGEHSDGEG